MLEIECDGKPESINGSELNLLYDMTDPEDKTFKCALADRCPIPYATEEGIGKRIREFYDSAGYVPVAMYVDGERLERLVPDNLTALHTSAIRFRGKITAVAWYVEHPRSPSGIHVEVAKHLISGPGFRLVKNNVPIGPRNIFGDSTLSKPLKEFIGEVHIISPDVEPDASGQDLRIGPARDFFIEALREFYDSLSRRADAKSRQLKSEKNVWQHAGAARGLGR